MKHVKKDLTKKRISELQQARINLKDNEHKFRALIEQSAEGIAILSAEGGLLYISPSIKKMLGYTVEEIMEIGLFAIIHEDDSKAMETVFKKVLENPGMPLKGHTGRIRHKDGSWRWLEATVTNRLHDPAIQGIVDNFRDVTDKKIEEEKLIHANRLYAFISQLNQSIVHSSDEHTVLKKACSTAIKFGKFKAVWIGMIDVESKTINVVEHDGLREEDLIYFTNVVYNNNEPQAYVLGTGTYSVINNIEAELELQDWKLFAFERGYKSSMVLPIRRKGSIIGTLNLYSSEIGFFKSEEIALLEEAAGDISFSLDLFEDNALKKSAEENLRYTQIHLKEAQSMAHLGSWEINFSTGVSVWSDELCRIYGLSPKENFQSYASWISFIHPDDLTQVKKMIAKSEASVKNMSFFHRILKNDGTIRHLHSHAHFQFDGNGKPVGLYGVALDITEIKEAENALHESELFSKGILASLESHIAVVEKNGNILAVNKAWDDFAKRNGVTALKRLSKGSNYFDVCIKAAAEGDAIAEQAMAGMHAVFKKRQETFVLEYPCDSPDEKRWFELHVSRFGNDGSKIVVTHHDISMRKNAEELLQLSQSNLKAVIENTDASIYSLDTELRYVTFNQQLKNSLRQVYDLFIAPGDHVYDFLEKLQPQEAKSWKKIYKKALAGETVKFEKEFVISGQPSYYDFAVYPIWKNKNVIGLSCFAFDITAQKLSAEAFRQSESRYRQIVETAQEGIWLVNENNETIFVNNKICAILGYERDEMMGKHIYSFMDQEGIRITELLSENKKKGKNSYGDFKYISKTGKDVWTKIAANPMFDDKGKYTGALGMITDITLRKKLSVLLDQANTIARLGTWEADLLNDTLYWSSITKKIHEVDDDFATDFETSLQFYKTGNSRTRIDQAIAEALNSVKGWDLELQIVTSKGNTCWVRTIGHAECLNGKCIRLSGSIQDIDGMKKAEESLEEKNKELKELSAYLQNVREAERKHIAREVHDELGQLASSLQIDVDWLGIKTQAMGENVNNRIVHAGKIIKELITTIRKIASGLRPSILDDFGLNAALQWYCNEFQQQNNIECVFGEAFNDEGLSTELKTELFRMSQESLTNVMRHSKAKKVTVSITEDAGLIYLSVTDNGVGFDTAIRKNTLGLLGLRERAVSINGELNITSSPGNGTTISAIIKKNKS